jgi:hypothetical protein
MDRTNCSDGLFTDTIMLYSGITGKCTQSIAAWLTVSISVLICRAFLTVWHFHLWFKRKHHLAARSVPVSKPRTPYGCLGQQRFPVTPLLSLCEMLFEVLFVVLVSANVASTRDGSSGFLVGTFIFCNNAVCLLTARRMIKLGSQLIPLSKGALTKGALQKHGYIGNFNLVMYLLYYSAAICALSAYMAFFLGWVAYPGDFQLFQIAACFLTVYQTLASSCAIYQYERCIQVIKMTMSSTAAAEIGMNSQSSTKLLRITIRTMRNQQVTILLSGWIVPLIILLGYTIGYIPLSWELICVQMFQNFLFFFLFSFTTRLPRKQKKGIVTNNNNNAVLAPGIFSGDQQLNQVSPEVKEQDPVVPAGGKSSNESRMSAAPAAISPAAGTADPHQQQEQHALVSLEY